LKEPNPVLSTSATTYLTRFSQACGGASPIAVVSGTTSAAGHPNSMTIIAPLVRILIIVSVVIIPIVMAVVAVAIITTIVIIGRRWRRY
jgi:hypothetical protein